MTAYFPIYADVSGRLCVVVGGGAVAERKVADLLAANAIARVVSPDVGDTLRDLAQNGAIEWLPVYYETAHLDGAWLVFAATNNRDVNARIARDATERHLFVNVADAPDEGSLLVPSVLRRGDLCLSVSTGGANPMLARKVAGELAQQYGAEYGPLVELLGRMRAYIKERTPLPALRRTALARLIAVEAELRGLLRTNDADGARQLAMNVVDGALTEEADVPPANAIE